MQDKTQFLLASLPLEAVEAEAKVVDHYKQYLEALAVVVLEIPITCLVLQVLQDRVMQGDKVALE
jgi:hypothetical protein